MDSDGKPLFPFGFGLSYTTFAYSGLHVQTPAPGTPGPVMVRVAVRNTGKRAGDDVVQLYFREVVTSIETPVRSLGGFERVSLAPNEAKTVSFTLRPDQLAVWNEEKRWVNEPGEFAVWAGGSSAAELSTRFRFV